MSVSDNCQFNDHPVLEAIETSSGVGCITCIESQSQESAQIEGSIFDNLQDKKALEAVEQEKIDQDLKSKLNEINEELNEDDFIQKFDEKIKFIENKIDESVKSLKEELSRYSKRFKSGLKDFKEEFKKLDLIKIFINLIFNLVCFFT
jgi:hypothetical protein